MKGMFSIVMPITRFSYLLDANAKPSVEHDNIQRFFRVGWKTLEKYIEWEDVHIFFIIIPAVHKPYFDKHVPVEVVSKIKCILEEDIVKYRTGKYSIQMISKLLIAKNHMKTDYYLVTLYGPKSSFELFYL